MRVLLCVLVLGCSSAAPVGPAAPGPGSEAAPGANTFLDPDEDSILGACDVCPDQPERVNDHANDDGCPESDEALRTVSADPSNRYSGPLLQVEFSSEGASAPLDRAWQLDGEIEAVACVVAAPDVALATQRSAELCKSLRASLGGARVEVHQHATTQPGFYRDDHTGRARQSDHGVGVVQVLRARGVEVWRWQDTQLVRIAKPRILESRPLPSGCTWASFQLDEPTQAWRPCPADGCDQARAAEGYRARWGGEPRYPR